MNISIYLPVIFVQIFLHACVVAACLGLCILITGWLTKVLHQRNSFWVAVLVLSMRKEKSAAWTLQMFSRLYYGFKKENPDVLAQARRMMMRDEDEINAKRLTWLHDYSTGVNDPEGYEWGIYRVKWENGRAVSVMQTNSDFSDLDAEMAREPHPVPPTCSACGMAMRYNVPRLGPDGGFVHCATGKLACGTGDGQ